MKKLFCSILLLASVSVTFAQQKVVKHVVEKGETITQIAQKYATTASEIYNLNPDAKVGLKLNQVLLIPTINSGQKNTSKSNNLVAKTHIVAAKESLYGLAKTYNTTINNLYEYNPGLEKSGLKIGDTIQVSKGNVAKSPIVKEFNSKLNSEQKTHEVKAKETKYGIANQYNLTVEQLEILNPEIKNGLQIGTILNIGNELSETKILDFKEVVTEKITSTKTQAAVDYVVQPQETIYSLSKKFGVTDQELLASNPILKDGLKDGMTIKIPSNKIELAKFTKNSSNLFQNLKTNDKKELAIMLPFNLSKIKNDTTLNISSRLSKDKFLNRILDFYSGALMAIDSAKVLGLNVNIKILDSQETKNSSSVASLIEQNNLKQSDLIIGPFYQVNVEKTAQILSKDSVLVMSPLSRDMGKLSHNIIHTMPSSADMRDAMLQFVKSKSGKIIAVIDPKKGSVRRYFTDNHSSIKLANFSPEGALNYDLLKANLDRNSKNFVILESANTVMLRSTINFLKNLLPEYDIQLVILESNDTLESDEISTANLAQLKLMFPSISRVNNSVEAIIFERKFKDVNNILPNAYARRGFDVTFDALLRLSQAKEFKNTLVTDVSEQVENKFNYTITENKGYKNKGFYILQYEPDYSVTVVQ